MRPGETRTMVLQFKNTGTSVWGNTSGPFVSIYTFNPRYRTSVFADPSWYRSIQPARLQEARVARNEVGTISFALKAPARAGTYAETFHLAAEDRAWIAGGQFTLNITVSDQAPAAPAAPAVSTPPAASAPADVEGLSALLLLRSARSVTAAGGESVPFTVGVKNTGTRAWTTRELRVPNFSIAADTRHASWQAPDLLTANAEGTIAPGGVDFFTFTFAAPRTSGAHTVRYALAVDGQAIPDFFIDIPVEVTSDAPHAYEAPVVQPGPEAPALMEEPMIRTGVLIVDEETDWEVDISCRVPWTLQDENGALLGELAANARVLAYYKNGKYWFNRGQGLETTSFPIRFIPNQPNEVCTVENFDRRVTRTSDRAYNTFRNVLELRYNTPKDRTWLINELPMEYYLNGLGETSNISHLEYQKALITAARTYAFYHWERGTKRGSEGFHVTAYADDQVYRGYEQESVSPRIVQSVQETRGVVVTYDGATAITPYFSRSDGRTRDWSEVWNGSVPWIKSVPAPCDAQRGYALWGHGVGMSAMEALCQANNGKEWRDILTYFYQGVDLTKYWN